MNKRTLIGLGVASALAAWVSMSHADVGIELTLVVDPSAQSWDVYAAVIDPGNETLGLHGISVDVGAGGGAEIADSIVELPACAELDLGSHGVFYKGFVVDRVDGTAGSKIGGAQVALDNFSPLGTDRSCVMRGVGKIAFTEPNLDLDPLDVPFPVYVATGAYNGSNGYLTVTSDTTRNTILPASLPKPAPYGTLFDPLHPQYVMEHTVVLPNGLMNSNSLRVAKLTVYGSVVLPTAAAGGDTSVVNQFQLMDQGKVNLADNALIVDYTSASPVSNIRNYILSAYANGAWTGNGLGSSAANASTYALGYAESAKVLGPSGGSFAGQKVDATAILVKQTMYGDTNLNGSVNIADFGNLRANYGKANKYWFDGDFDYNGEVNADDVARLKANFGRTSPKPKTSTPASALAFTAASEAVPVLPHQARLLVETLTGNIKIVGTNDAPASLTGYEIISISGSLVPDQFASLTDKGLDGWMKLFVHEGYLAEGTVGSPIVINATGVSLGGIYKLTGTSDLIFNWIDGDGASFSGIVEYSTVVPEPATLSLLAGAALLMARRRAQFAH